MRRMLGFVCVRAACSFVGWGAFLLDCQSLLAHRRMLERLLPGAISGGGGTLPMSPARVSRVLDFLGLEPQAEISLFSEYETRPAADAGPDASLAPVLVAAQADPRPAASPTSHRLDQGHRSG